MHNKSAVELFKGRSSQFCILGGRMMESGFLTKRQIKNPIIAFQKPMTIQGRVNKKRTIDDHRMGAGKYGFSA
jgi:hypothetical protein